MPITPSYPGIYIEEIRSTAHTITPAPTSIAVFIGYSHPFKTDVKANAFGTAVRIQSFQEYVRAFGGFFTSDVIPGYLPYAVNQFFLNGGSDCYVVGLQPAPATLVAPHTDIGGITFTAREPADANHPITVVFSNPQPLLPNTPIDITITYGSTVETYRKVNTLSTDPRYIEKVIGTAAMPASALVTVSPTGANYPAALSATTGSVFMNPLPVSVFDAQDFVNVFLADSSLDKVEIFNLLILPGVSDNLVLSEALAFAEGKRAFLIMDAPQILAADPASSLPGIPPIGGDSTSYIESGVVPKSQNGALYFPWIKSSDVLTDSPIELPPSGSVAGIYAKTDTNRGVWKAPAGLETSLLNTTGVVDRGRMSDMRQGILNPQGVNCLRTFSDAGTVVFGARTLVTENPALKQMYSYIPVRRMMLFIEQTLYRELKWAIMEPNDEPLWSALRTSVDTFMLSLFRQGAFQGLTPSQSFFVTCDSSTTTQADIDMGVVNILVGFRPLKPAEFVVVQISQMAGQAQP